MLTFSDIFRYEPDGWGAEGRMFTAPQNLEELARLLDRGCFLVAVHWHYRGARCPDRLVVEDYEAFIEYLEKNAIAGDIVEVFDLSDAWKQKGAPLVSGKCPDERGEIPQRGAY